MAQQFQVPQFIEREGKLIGAFTLKQSALLGGGGAMLFVLWFMLEKWLFFIAAFPLILMLLVIGFMKVNGRPMIDFVGAFFSYFISPQLYIWQKQRERMTKLSRKAKIEKFASPSVEITKQGIRDLAKNIDRG